MLRFRIARCRWAPPAGSLTGTSHNGRRQKYAPHSSLLFAAVMALMGMLSNRSEAEAVSFDKVNNGYLNGRILSILEQEHIKGAGTIIKSLPTLLALPVGIVFRPVGSPVYIPFDRPNVSNDSGSATTYSRDRNTAVGYLDNGFFTYYHAFRWTESSGTIDIGTLDPTHDATTSSFGHDVSSDGSMIVGYSSIASGSEHAFLWTQTPAWLISTPVAARFRGRTASAATGASSLACETFSRSAGHLPVGSKVSGRALKWQMPSLPTDPLWLVRLRPASVEALSVGAKPMACKIWAYSPETHKR